MTYFFLLFELSYGVHRRRRRRRRLIFIYYINTFIYFYEA